MSDTPFHLGHVHLKVRDLERSVEFYRDVFDLEVTEEHDRFAFLSWSDHHHDVALQSVGGDAPDAGRGVGLYHAAIEVDTEAELGAVYDRLAARDVPVTLVDHGISKALYFADPAGNGLEAYVDTREAESVETWDGRNERFDPTAL